VRGAWLSFIAVCACGPGSRPNFGGGGSRDPETFDTDGPFLRVRNFHSFLDYLPLSSCMGRGEVEASAQDEPPDVVGAYQLDGEAVASDTWPVGTAVSSAVCLFDQTAGGAIAMRDESSTSQSVSAQAWITGIGDRFSVFAELYSTDPYDDGCTIQTLAVLAGTVSDSGDLELRSASVPAGMDGCSELYEDLLGACWASAAIATLTGDCEG
jgi:hypothetical protein